MSRKEVYDRLSMQSPYEESTIILPAMMRAPYARCHTLPSLPCLLVFPILPHGLSVGQSRL
jgi:hypothetical protein